MNKYMVDRNIQEDIENFANKIAFVKLAENAHIPCKAHEDDAGFDLYSTESTTLKAHEFKLVGTGIAMALKPGTEAQVRPRSGLAAKHGITVLNAPGTIDAGYRGEVKVCLINHSDTDFEIEEGMRIAQLVVAPVFYCSFHEVETLDESDRGEGGFGSTGTN